MLCTIMAHIMSVQYTILTLSNNLFFYIFLWFSLFSYIFLYFTPLFHILLYFSIFFCIFVYFSVFLYIFGYYLTPFHPPLLYFTLIYSICILVLQYDGKVKVQFFCSVLPNSITYIRALFFYVFLYFPGGGGHY